MSWLIPHLLDGSKAWACIVKTTVLNPKKGYLIRGEKKDYT